MGKLINVNKDEFHKIIESETGLILVDFYADWCGPCRVLGPILNDIAKDVEDVTILKINVDEADNSILSTQLEIRGIPAVIIFRNGKQVDKFVGLKQKSDIISIIERNTEPKVDESKN